MWPHPGTPAAFEPRHLSRRDLFRVPPPAEPLPSGYLIRIYRQAMACRFEVTLPGEDARHVAAARAALDLVDAIEAHLTVFRDTSPLVRLNHLARRDWTPIDADLFALLDTCRDLHAGTGGAFDVTTTPLSRCWGFLRREGRLPAVPEVEAALGSVGMDGVELDPASGRVRFRKPAMELNLGAIGKGYALDRVAKDLRRRDVRHALVSAGRSSLLALGGRGNDWTVDVRSPRARGRLARVTVRDGALGTSGAGEQFVEVEGVRYGHVLDPRTGWPASGVLSATVVTGSAAAADALSTAFLVGGAELAQQYCAAHSGVLALVTPDDGSERPIVFGRYPGAILED